MSQILSSALQSYKSGKYKKTLELLAPILHQTSVSPEILLLAAQCHSKAGQYGDAAGFYERAARHKHGAEAILLQTLTARMRILAQDLEGALPSARAAARSGVFNADAEQTWRRILRFTLSLPEIEHEQAAFLARLAANDPVFLSIEDPLDHISWCEDEAINARITINPATAFTEDSRRARRGRPHAWNEKLRIGYLSNDYSDQHATMMLFQGVILAHDREKYDVYHFCHTPAGVVSTDKGKRKLYPNIVPISTEDDAAEKCIRKYNLDILIDLKGHTKDTRIALINRGLAPVQVAYLGFPGSGVGIDCDYVISDPVVTPDGSRPFYHEKLCRLPECYQSNDNRFRALPAAASRETLGLPEDRFVFASFNAIRKVTPETARLWAQALKAVPGSLLWMMCEGELARRNFTGFMEALGITPDRLLFTESVDHVTHIARLQAADLGLDTFPYNGHTTTSDKLWAGLPVVTKRGGNFASRVSESLLNALGVPELVAADADGFVALCRDLASDRQRLAGLRRKIAANRFTQPLFDTERFTRHLERAYEMMAERGRAGLAPDHIDVPPLPPRGGSFQPIEI